MDDTELELIATKIWGIWKERCDLIHSNNRFHSGSKVRAYWTEAFLENFHREKDKLYIGRYSPPISISPDYSYHNPDGNVIKVDASYKEATSSFAVGFFIYDKEGKPRAAGFHKINPPGSVLAAELIAIIDGLNFWKTISQDTITILSDSKDAIRAIYSDSPYKGYEESIILMARRLIRHSPEVEARFSPRTNITEAHKLANMATRSLSSQAWVGEDIPRHILSLAHN